MNQFNLFVELTRLKKPIGYMLLFWPCSWGLTLAYDFSNNLDKYFLYLFLFFLGSILMRSAGCIVNDIFDRKFDKKVFRTKDRPIASGKISIYLGLFYSGILCFLALLVLINFNSITIILALGSMPLAFSYPLMKRYTYWPQLFLGITFNYGLILGWTSITEQLNIIGWGTNSRGVIGLAILLILFRNNLLSPEMYSNLVLMILVTTIAFIIVASRYIKQNRKILNKTQEQINRSQWDYLMDFN